MLLSPSPRSSQQGEVGSGGGAGHSLAGPITPGGAGQELEPCWEGQPQLAGDIGRTGSAGDFTEETITQTKQNQNFIVPSKGLMPGNEWSPCPLPLGDKQNSAG